MSARTPSVPLPARVRARAAPAGGAGARVRAGDDRPRLAIPGLGPRTMARVGQRTRQVFVVSADGAGANRSTAALWERHPAEGWRRTAGPWPARNALKGWTDDHRMDDLRSPTGVYGLTDAGGLLPDPGTELPYDRGPAFQAPPGTNFDGEPLTGAFDHVVAINYNRVPGRTPLDWETPLGLGKGRGIWIHADHGGATRGCIAVARTKVAELLRKLDPGARPVIAMGPETTLAR